MNPTKQKLYQQCLNYVQTRMDAAQQAIDEAQRAQQDDTKSSAGDKYETGREMAQQETNRNMAQLAEANKLKIALNTINPNVVANQVDNGAIVLTNNGNFYIGISAGALVVDEVSYFAVSLASPIGIKMRGLKAGTKFNLNGKDYSISQVI
ncbi:3-oxoacyl-ACP synthase [Mucilaginibacter antarcticus]|uniref:3-oxoacyl-ACP synthase n=1 Tax=Mucilaginibacter antarcticus TaxID=1855725 RepID=A0ABW5XJV7_9SPHI